MNYIPERFTGFYDKTDKKIFENDYWIDEEGDIFVVEFRHGKFCFVIYGYDDELFGFSGFGEIDCVAMEDYEIKKIEFIGSIYEEAKLAKKIKGE